MKRVEKLVHDVSVHPPVGVLHFIAHVGGFRAVRFTDIEKISGSLGVTEVRQTVTEQLKEARETRRATKRSARRARRAAR